MKLIKKILLRNTLQAWTSQEMKPFKQHSIKIISQFIILMMKVKGQYIKLLTINIFFQQNINGQELNSPMMGWL